jgi:hypothetical protein
MVDTTKLKRPIVLSSSFNIFDFKYRAPKKKDLAICYIYFNAAKSKRILMNYLYVSEKLKVADIPFFTIEMHTGLPEIKDAIHLKTDTILFQKERLANILVKQIPEKFTKLAFIDSDLVFENINWYNELSKKLNRFNAVQVFSKFVRLDMTFSKLIDECFSFVLKKEFGDVYKVGKIGFNPGGGWGFQRKWFEQVGFFEDDILGGSDTYSVQNWNIIPDTYVYPTFIQDSIIKYKKKVLEIGSPSVSFLSGNAYHLWHGDTNKKQYRTRKNILKGIKDVKDIVKTNKSGLFTLKSTTLKKRFRKYFEDRDDDGLPSECS